jgi:hypothetical protein
MICSNCGHEEIDHEGIGNTDMKYRAEIGYNCKKLKKKEMKRCKF